METPLTPLEFARRARSLYADRLAVVDGDQRWTYGEFFARCDRWASVLASWGVRHGDRVAYIAPNTHAQLESFYAIPQLGAVLVPLNYRLTGDDFAYMIEHSGAKVVCVHADYLGVAQQIRARVPHVEHWVALEGAADGFEDYEALVAGGGAAPVVAVAESDLLTINYTSGTTSRPKGVMITHRNAWMNTVGTLLHHPMTPADRYLWTLPMFHANGWTFVWTVTAIGGAHICLRKVAPDEIFALAAREHVTALCCAPTVLIGVANATRPAGVPRGVRVLTAGAPPAAATIERVEGELGWIVTHVYGLTETAPFITICEPRAEHDQLSPAERAIVKARQGVELVTSGELRVVDLDLRDVPRDGATIGEIVVRGNVVMAGYYNDPDATERAFAGGYFHTGDSAVVHPDGYVEIRDRMKDVIISGGENISSIEVEAALLRHPAVQEVAIVGLPHEKWGEAPFGFVVLKPGAAATEAELREFARGHLAHFKAPQGITFVTELPKTATGKIQKYVLRGGKAAISRQ
ncbi:MAG TPA: long-chain-fatty-acid--CoA ligase [Kofleriaceae bacterium]|jgi:fatty-acyl-CoA synthase